jgi:hypothetical protein
MVAEGSKIGLKTRYKTRKKAGFSSPALQDYRTANSMQFTQTA